MRGELPPPDDPQSLEDGTSLAESHPWMKEPYTRDPYWPDPYAGLR
ncbi:MAG: hypothetical protein LWX11_06940 [Firmicutes bacterium]|nr:hypothetical protein [Bacillota bacterium]